MRLIKCKACGLIFQATGEICFCENCRKERMNTHFQERTCRNCGASFMGYPRSFFCEECGEQRKRERKKEYNRRQKEGKTLKIGSMKHCESCGEEFSINSARQRYCSKCRNLAVKKNVSALKTEYRKEHAEEQLSRQKENKKFRKVCIVCGKNFDSKTSTTTCSEECKNEAIAISGARTAQRYNGRKTEYGVRKYSDTPKSGIPGIAYNRKLKKWQVTYKRVYIGILPTIDEAKNALDEYKKNPDVKKKGGNE